MKVSVIVAAAGAGKRFGGKENKIFARIGAQAVFLKSLELFANRDDVVQTVLIVGADDLDAVKDKYGGNLGLMGVQIVVGGAERTDSVRNALAALSDEADHVAVHDAVRPCVSQVWIDAVFAEASKSGAAILAYPVHGTLKKATALDERPDQAAGDLEKVFGPGAGKSRKKPPPLWVIDETVPRAGLWEAQTPQVFRRDLIEAAYAKAGAGSFTDDSQMIEAIGHAVHIVLGDPRNIKITTPGDLALVSAVIGSLPKPKPKGPMVAFDEAQW